MKLVHIYMIRHKTFLVKIVTVIRAVQFYIDYTRLPPDLVDITDSVTNGVPKGFTTGPLPLQYLAWFRVTHLMQPFWRAHMTLTRYHIPHVITLWNQLLAHFHTFYPDNIDPLLLLPSMNEPGLDENS